MKKSFLLLISIFLLLFLFNVVSYAEDAYSIQKVVSDGIITIVGDVSAEKNGSMVTLTVMKPDTYWDNTTWSSGTSTGVVYFDSCVASNNKFKFEFALEESGLYNAIIGVQGEATPLNKYLGFVISSESIEAIQAINEAAAENPSNIAQVLTDYRYALALYTNYFDMVNLVKASSILYSYIELNELDENSPNTAVNIIERCLFVEALNEGKITDILDYSEQFGIVGSDFEVYYMPSKSSNILSRVANKNFTNINDFNYAVKEAVLLNKIRFADGYGESADVLRTFADTMKIKSEWMTTTHYKAITGQYFENYSGLRTALESIKSSDTSNSVISNNNPSSSKKIDLSGVTISSNIVNMTDDMNKDDSVTNLFDDIASVPWAKNEIENLFLKGIINGKSEKKFYPLDNITREEFVKMIIITFDLGNINADKTNFEDVAEDGWYAEYINKAYQCNIVNGITDKTFGVGNNISRQDMAVMVLNALEACQIQLANGVDIEKNKFVDEDSISDYAKETVNRLKTVGIIAGDETDRFNPENYATRAEAAKILDKILSILKQQ